MVSKRCWRASSTCIRCDSVTSVSSTTSPPLANRACEILTNLAAAQLHLLAYRRIDRGARQHRRPALPEQRLAQQCARRPDCFLDLAAADPAPARRPAGP
jgi:hypothetical protein